MKNHYVAIQLFISILLLLVAVFANASGEKLGNFEFSEITLVPSFELEEPSSGGFNLSKSWIGFRWNKEETVSAVFNIGTRDLIRPAIWFETKEGDIALTLAAIEIKYEYFDLRAGLLPIIQSFESSRPEWDLLLPETRVRKHRWFVKRDYGIEIRTKFNEFLGVWSVHNGESAANLDQKVWSSGMWSFQNSWGFGSMVTAFVGRTDARSTAQSKGTAIDEGFNFDISEPAKFRQGAFAIYRSWGKNLVLAEIGKGEILQKDDKQGFNWGHFDICSEVDKNWSLLARYEHSQANVRRSETITKSTGFGFAYSTDDRLSQITVWAQKNQQQPEDRADDEFLLQYRMNSNLL